MINYSYSFNRDNMNASEIENHTIEHFTKVCERRYKNKGYSSFSDYLNNRFFEKIIDHGKLKKWKFYISGKYG